MAPQPKAMLFALTSPHSSIPLDEFNKWYDERHAPSRAACSGVHSVSRFRLVEDEQSNKLVGDWTWLAIYELENDGALQTDEYKKARKEDGDDESMMIGFLSRRVYKQIADQRRDDYGEYTSSRKSRMLTMVGLTSASSSAPAELDRWQQVLANGKSEGQGWLRTSSWRLTTAADPRTWEEQTNVPEVLFLHEREAVDAMHESEAVQKTLETVAQNVNDRVEEVASLKLWKQF